MIIQEGGDLRQKEKRQGMSWIEQMSRSFKPVQTTQIISPFTSGNQYLFVGGRKAQ